MFRIMLFPLLAIISLQVTWLSEVNDIFKTILEIILAGYTFYKFYTEFSKRKKTKRNDNTIQ